MNTLLLNQRRLLGLAPVLLGCVLYITMALIGVAHDSGTYAMSTFTSRPRIPQLLGRSTTTV